MTIRVVECGGSGFRMMDVSAKNSLGKEISPAKPILTVDSLVGFVGQTKLFGVEAVIFSIAAEVYGNKTIARSPNIPFLSGADLVTLVSSVYGVPAFVANDMETAVTGMAGMFELDHFLGLTWSSGIGGRIFCEGRLLGYEMGHLQIDPSVFAPLCGYECRGCIESIAGGEAVKKRVQAELATRGLKLPDNMKEWPFLDHSYQAGHPWAIAVYNIITTAMGRYLAQLQNQLFLQNIVWKGGCAQKSFRLPSIEYSVREVMRQYVVNQRLVDELKFHFVPLGPKDGESFIGANIIARRLLG